MTSVVAGICVGIVSTCIQSFGLALQRKSHIENEATPLEARQPDWKRPLWLSGFLIYILSNVFGSIFQLQALPIVILAPLGALSLISNAFFALILLHEHFARNLIYGTVLISFGAVLIAIFGAVPEPSHNLQELLVLYKRPAFLGVFFALCFIVVVVLLSAHVLEWSVHHSRHARAQQDSRERDKSHRDAAFERLNGQAPDQQQDMDLDERQPLLASKTPATTSDHHAESHRLLVAGLAYGSCSGALSGLGLLFAKTGVELLILSTVGGQNQFGHWQAWMIVLVLLVTDLTQLWYLNHSLRLLGPTLICPLACCFYNLSSIFNGLIFYNQWSQLSPLQISMLCVGITVLLAGVWIVSLQPGDASSNDAAGDDEDGVELFEEDPDNYDWELSQPIKRSKLDSVKRMLLEDAPRGFRIGLAASSPGFAIRPLEHYRRLRGSHATFSLPPLTDEEPLPAATDIRVSVSSLPPPGETFSTPAFGTARIRPGSNSSSSRNHEKQRSLAGDVYVGRSHSIDLHRSLSLTASPPPSPLGSQRQDGEPGYSDHRSSRGSRNMLRRLSQQ